MSHRVILHFVFQGESVGIGYMGTFLIIFFGKAFKRFFPNHFPITGFQIVVGSYE